ncbi:unnamed protein product [Miscanthus lutarioriparius]|uniref:Uncharacterized protein n=1 Tax=Miscanthus lutarioriparius TaxID=422564 RepID=A0A811RDU2_9POAL|nr:unnamed protein product [Miscanthus lutarioriparius]CAD6268172.1 unnamed protein product [Miscanthus lutarioriparius]
MEEFTFPSSPLEQYNAKKVPFPHFASASPWLVVPGGVVDTAVHDHDHRRSFSAVEPQEAAGSDYHHQHQQQLGGYDHHRHGSARFAVEDKMDMLWEDFNEELARAAQPCPLTKGTPSWATAKESWLDGDGYGYEGAFETRKHAVIRRRRMGLLMMLRLLKKLFLAHKSGAAPSRKAPPI